MKKTSFLPILAFLCCSVTAQAQWTTSGNNIYNSNTGNVGIRTTNPVYPFQIFDGGTNAYTGISFMPGLNGADNGIIKTLKAGGLGLILRAENHDAGKGQAGIYLRSADGISIPAKVTLYGNHLELRTGLAYTDAVNGSVVGTPALFVDNDQRTGLGMTNPTQRLTVNGNIFLGDFTTGVGSAGSATFLKMNDRVAFQATTNGTNAWTRGIVGQNILWNNTTNVWDIGGPYSDFATMRMEDAGSLGFYTNTNTNSGYSLTETGIKQYRRMFITGDGRVIIGNINPATQYKLAVDGKIGARSIKVTMESWADYVFNNSYNLMSLASLEKFIKENNHLPNIPSAEEVKKNEGIDLGEMNVKLLEKIEELTLHVIEMNKKMEETKKRVDVLEKENARLKKK